MNEPRKIAWSDVIGPASIPFGCFSVVMYVMYFSNYDPQSDGELLLVGLASFVGGIVAFFSFLGLRALLQWLRR